MPKTVSSDEIALKRGLPCNIEAERIFLGAILHDNGAMTACESLISDADFMLEKHRRIFLCMQELHKATSPIDRVTLMNALLTKGHLESVDGLGYIVSLDEGMPEVISPQSYATIIREKAVLRRISFVSQTAVAQALSADASPSDLLAGLETSLAGLSGELAAGDNARHVGEIIDEIGINNLLNPCGDMAGMLTSFHDLDDRTTGFQRQTLTFIAARPSVGKSAFMTDIAVNMAEKSNIPVAIFSMEMSKRNLIERMACAKSRINLMRMRSGILSADERKSLLASAAAIKKLPIYIDDSSAQTYQQISGKLDRLRRKYAVKACFIDYLQQMGYDLKKGARDRNDNERFTEIAEALKSMAKRQDVAVVALSQLNRGPEMRGRDHRPLLSDLRASGGLEQAADLVLMIYREHMYKPEKTELKDRAEIIIAKQRNGPTGSITVCWRPDCASFSNIFRDLTEAKGA